ncbi:hypothetical protein N7510_007202 [Penicillium lagena]|uniref:uncharacterized protein n=1 Tax=Penicillium lagena TaxID=94218 RepID=UPI0025417188|nr:uncharacterized protein N7510_007202 [Penicillium lagena]KAJ5610483.1 hypothetical protein N7510_007202 [Penicillium lagena]
MIVARPSLLLRPLVFSLLVVSALSSKTLHLFQHAGSLPSALFVLYFPTFFIQEAFLFAGAWFLLHKTTGLRSVFGAGLTAFLSCLTFILSASQIGFYFVTGSEIRWDAATSVGNDPEGRKLMFSGLRSFLGAAAMLLVASWICTTGICMLMTKWLSAVFSASSPEKVDEELPLAHLQQTFRKERLVRFWTICAILASLGLRIVRPRVPYNHMSGALPFTFFEAIRLKHVAHHEPINGEFPFPELIGEEYWEASNGHFKGWAPGMSRLRTDDTQPPWAAGPLPTGFRRWRELANLENEDILFNGQDPEESRKGFYNPVDDPLRITNLNHGLLEPLARALKDHDIPITHVVLVMMESARKDIFPLKSGSHLHQEILSSHRNADAKSLHDLNDKLARLTPVAERLTGESGGFSSLKGDPDALETEWKDSAGPDMGGINVNGVLTGSTLSFKSAVMNHCGVGPLPIDFMGEVKAEIYQPCIMQVLELFNQLQPKSTSDDARFQDRNWTSVFLQSITGEYDEQSNLNNRMGFTKALYREDIDQPKAEHYHPHMEEINYFGFSEREIYPYLQDVVKGALENNERLFLSHFTSTTHHPWSTPEEFHKEQYLADDSLIAEHEDMNNYLNAVHYVDTWLGDMLKVLDDNDIANETLVVLVGDHGQAFQEDAPVTGTYENGHISNFRIPLVFRHPLLPRLQITANATSMSVVPTILDLLVNTKSLNEKDSAAAQDLMNEYEGQSLIRPYQATHNGRQAWNFGIINAGGTMLSVGSAAVPYRLILPLTPDFEFAFSDLDVDPDELSPLRGWTQEEVIDRVREQHGDKAAEWVADAANVGRWWVDERKRLWHHHY